MSTSNPHISEPIQSVVPDMDVGSSSQTHSVLQPQRPLDPRSSVEDYNRVMRDYTQRRMSTFADKDDHISGGRGVSTSSRQSSQSSESGGNSGGSSIHHSPSNTTSGLLARQQHQMQRGKTAGSGAEEQVMQNANMGF